MCWLILALLIGPFVWFIWSIYTWNSKPKKPDVDTSQSNQSINNTVGSGDQSLLTIPLLTPGQRDDVDDESNLIICASVPAQGPPSGAVFASPLPSSPRALSTSLPATVSSDFANSKLQAKVAAIQLPKVPLLSLSLTYMCGRPGDSGTVYKVQYQGKDAAAKKFHEHKQHMLKRELTSLHVMAHPNIVRLLAIITGDASQPIGFMMEYLPVSLEDAMHTMTLRQAVHALAEACIGLAVTHDAHLIHSDIKPGNILCSEDFLVVKLADFGLAHAITASMSVVSGARGTALFMAPELHHDAPLSVLTDVFSFGMTAWQMLHPGIVNPFGSNHVTISFKLGQGLRPDFTRADAPPALMDLVTRCHAQDPSQRPSSMWDVYRELQAIMQQLPDSTPPTTLAALLSQPVLSVPSHSLPSGGIRLVDEATSSDFCSFVRSRVRREHAAVSISRISRVLLGGARVSTYLDMFMREMNSRRHNPLLRPDNFTDSAFVAGLNKLKSLFEHTCLGPSPSCNIVFAWHGTPAEHVEAVCRDGPRAFRTTDGGFFGAGSYFAMELEYATQYAMMRVRCRAQFIPSEILRTVHDYLFLFLLQAPSANDEYPVILFAVSVASTYVVTPGRDYPADDPSHPELWGFSKFYSADASRSVALLPRFNAHFIPVRECNRTHCVTGKVVPMDTGYQAAVAGDASEWLHRMRVSWRHLWW